MSVSEFDDHALVFPDLDIETVEMGPGLVHGEFIVLRLKLEAADNMAFFVNGIGTILSYGGKPEHLTFLNPGRIFPSPVSASRWGEPAGTDIALDCLKVELWNCA
jgi:hypothetical protein